MPKQILYDPECEKLATHFITNARDRHRIPALAQAIQTAVENFLEDESEADVMADHPDAGGRPYATPK